MISTPRTGSPRPTASGPKITRTALKNQSNPFSFLIKAVGSRIFRRSAVFLFINVLRHFTAQRAVSQIPRGFILLKKGLCKTQSPFFWLGWRDSNPRGDGVKVRCLTAWRQPNIRYPKSIAYFRPLVKRFKQRKAARKQVFLLRTAPYLS